MKAQEIFDAAYEGVTRQGKPSISQEGTCLYRMGNLMCAAGHVVEHMGLSEDSDWWHTLGDWNEAMDYLPDDMHTVLKEHRALIVELQYAHDIAATKCSNNGFIDRYNARMADVAKEFNLKMPEVSNDN